MRPRSLTDVAYANVHATAGGTSSRRSRAGDAGVRTSHADVRKNGSSYAVPTTRSELLIEAASLFRIPGTRSTRIAPFELRKKARTRPVDVEADPTMSLRASIAAPWPWLKPP